MIHELAGADLGLLEQELAKLSAYVGQRTTIEIADVETLVGGWATETTWSIAAAVRRGETGEALDLLNQLLDAGESAYKILGGLTFVFRRLAQAVALSGQGTSLDRALGEAGVFPREIGESAAYLRRLGRAEAQWISSRLLEADSALKGALPDPRAASARDAAGEAGRDICLVPAKMTGYSPKRHSTPLLGKPVWT